MPSRASLIIPNPSIEDLIAVLLGMPWSRLPPDRPQFGKQPRVVFGLVGGERSHPG
jgi:hypothetical protein